MKKSFPFALFLTILAICGCNGNSQEESLQREILRAFESLQTSLETTEENYSERNEDTKALIVDHVQGQIDQGNHQDAAFIEHCEAISQKSNAMTHFLDGLSEDLLVFTDVHPTTGEMQNMGEKPESMAFMLGEHPNSNGGSGDGAGFQLRKKLEAYEDWAGGLLTYHGGEKAGQAALEPIVVLPEDDPQYEKDPEKAALTWEAVHFADQPVIADLAYMETLKLGVEKIESALLDVLKSQLSGLTFKVDSLIAVDSSGSVVEAAGMKFQTKTFVKTE